MMPRMTDMQIQYEVASDFMNIDTTNDWTAVNDGGTGTNTLDATAGGTYSVVTAAADNDYHVLVSKAKTIGLAANKPIWFEARVKLTEANTDDANIILGITDTSTSGNLQADGAGPAANHDGVVLYKVDGGTTWGAHSSNGTAQTSSASFATFTSGAWHRVGFHVDSGDGTTADVKFWVHNETTGARTITSAPHKLTIASFGPCHVIFGVKAGGANAETLIVDYVRCIGTR